MLTTNSPAPPSAAAAQFLSVSLSDPSGLFAGQKSSIIGSEPTPLKKEKGATFGRPSADTVETTAIGRGTIPPIMSLYRSGWESWLGRNSIEPSVRPRRRSTGTIPRPGNYDRL